MSIGSMLQMEKLKDKKAGSSPHITQLVNQRRDSNQADGLWCPCSQAELFCKDKEQNLWFAPGRSGLPRWLSGKEATCQCRRDIRDSDSIPWLERSPGGGPGNPLQDCLENPMDRGAWQAIVHGITKRHN